VLTFIAISWNPDNLRLVARIEEVIYDVVSKQPIKLDTPHPPNLLSVRHTRGVGFAADRLKVYVMPSEMDGHSRSKPCRLTINDHFQVRDNST
jgi:hypothetical protein